MGIEVRWIEGLHSNSIHKESSLRSLWMNDACFPSSANVLQNERTIYGFSCHLKTQPCVDKNYKRNIFARRSWIELIVVANGDQLSGRQVEHGRRERERDREAFCETKIHQNWQSDRSWNFFSIVERKEKHKKCANCIRRVNMRHSEKVRERWRHHWRSWTSKIKINCKIVYLSANQVESWAAEREGKARCCASFPFSPIIKSELLLLFINANWRFRINFAFNPRKAIAAFIRCAVWSCTHEFSVSWLVTNSARDGTWNVNVTLPAYACLSRCLLKKAAKLSDF